MIVMMSMHRIMSQPQGFSCRDFECYIIKVSFFALSILHPHKLTKLLQLEEWKGAGLPYYSTPIAGSDIYPFLTPCSARDEY